MANVASKAFVVKQKTLNNEDTPISSSHFRSSTFINLNDSYDEMSPCLWILMWMFLVHFYPWFQCVHYRGCALKFESHSWLELWNFNRLFESNVCCTTFVKQVEVIKLQQDQSPICFLSAHHIWWWHHLWTATHPSSNWTNVKHGPQVQWSCLV